MPRYAIYHTDYVSISEADDPKVYQPGKNEIEYDYYNTGNDGLHWDCIQLHYLAKKLTLNNQSPVFKCKINGRAVTQDEIGESYVRMVERFENGDVDMLWDFRDAIKATKKVNKFLGIQSKFLENYHSPCDVMTTHGKMELEWRQSI